MHLLEWEDQRWLPPRIRHGVTAYLQFVGNLSAAPYRHFAGALAEAMRSTGDTVLLDLCSGASGPLPTLLGMLREQGVEAQAVLTDLFPDTRAFARVQEASGSTITYRSEPVDATRVGAELPGFRILCNGFHHFEPDAARRILADAVQSRRGIALFEGVERRWPAVAACVAAVLAVPVATLFMRPWRWDRAALTYLLPVIPWVTAWDGVVSCLRVYSPAELRALVASIPGHADYHWHIQRDSVPRSPLGATCLVGYPRETERQTPVEARSKAARVPAARTLAS